MSFHEYEKIAASDFATEVGKGKIFGHEFRGIQSRKDSTSTIFTDIWGGSVDLVYPTGPETWEIVSSDAADSASGTGARTGFVFSLDDNFVEQVTPFDLDGITPVTLSGSHYRPREVVIVTAGSSGSNEGVVTLRQSGGGLERSIVNIGQSRSFSSHFTIPAGKRGIFLQTFSLFEKNFNGESRIRARDATNPGAAWISNVPVPLYDNLVPLTINAKIAIPEKTDVVGQVMTEGVGGTMVLIMEIMIFDM